MKDLKKYTSPGVELIPIQIEYSACNTYVDTPSSGGEDLDPEIGTW